MMNKKNKYTSSAVSDFPFDFIENDDGHIGLVLPTHTIPSEVMDISYRFISSGVVLVFDGKNELGLTIIPDDLLDKLRIHGNATIAEADENGFGREWEAKPVE